MTDETTNSSRKPEPDVRGNGLLFVIFLLAAQLIFWYFPFFESKAYSNPGGIPANEKMLGEDFINLLVAGKAALAGHSIYKNNEAFGEEYVDPFNSNPDLARYPYPPLAAYLFIPFSFLPYLVAYHAWFFLQIAMVCALAYFQRDLLRGRTECGAIILLASLLSYPMLFALERGNFDTLAIFLLFTGVHLWERRKNPYLIGFLLALAGCLKLYPFIFLCYFLVKKEWRIAAATVLFSSLLSVSFGFRHIPDYGFVFANLVSNLKTYLWSGNHSTVVFFLRSLCVHSNVSVDKALLLANIFNVALVAAVFGYILMAKNNHRLTRLGEMAALCCAMTICPPISFDYNLVFIFYFIPVFIGLAAKKKRGPSTCLLFLLTALLMVSTWRVEDAGSNLLKLFVASKFPTIIGLIIVVIANIEQFKRTPRLSS